MVCLNVDDEDSNSARRQPVTPPTVISVVPLQLTREPESDQDDDCIEISQLLVFTMFKSRLATGLLSQESVPLR